MNGKFLSVLFLVLIIGLLAGYFLLPMVSGSKGSSSSGIYGDGKSGGTLAQVKTSMAGPPTARTSLIDPTGTITNNYAYFPGSEELRPDEIRIVAAGTGMPASRRGQAGASFLIELGNGDKFVFDLGAGAMRNLMALNVPPDYMTKVFLTHLHTDHWGDLDTLWAGGWTGGRTKALEVWGPSGPEEDMGTAYAVENFLNTYNWDYVTRVAKVNALPGKIIAHEFDARGINEIIYEENGVVIRSIPAVHIAEGPVSFILEWKGYKVVYAGDTAPNKWFMEYAKNADILINEAMLTPEQLMQFYGQPPARAMMMQQDIHTSAQAFGKIAGVLKPRLAVAYHFFNEEGTRYGIYDAIRKTYSGPLSMADDLMVWNLNRGGIRERMTIPVDDAWDVASPDDPPPPPENPEKLETDFLTNGRYDVSDVEEPAFAEFKRIHGLD